MQVKPGRETVWLTQKPMAELFDKNVITVNEHIKNPFAEGELEETSVIRNFRITANIPDLALSRLRRPSSLWPCPRYIDVYPIPINWPSRLPPDDALASFLLSYIQFSILHMMKPVRFLGDSLKCLRDFPEDARHDAGYQLDKVQRGEQPDDFKPMRSIGKGVEEIRVRDHTGAYRLIYIARLAEAVYVLHAFPKKTQATSSRDIAIAKERLGQLMRERT